MDYSQVQRRGTASLVIVALCCFTAVGCGGGKLPLESSRAMRIRMEVESALDRLEHGTGHGMALGQLVPRINVELGREANGLGEHFETCQQLRVGLIELGELKGNKQTEKIQELRTLTAKLPEIES